MAAFGTGEHAPVVGWLGEVVQMPAEFGQQQTEDGDRAVARLGLGRSDELAAVLELGSSLDDAHLEIGEIDVAATVTEQFAFAEAEEAGAEHETAG